MNKQIEKPIKPQYIPLKCPVCNGWKTVGYNKLPCTVCKELGYIKVPPLEEGEIDNDGH